MVKKKWRENPLSRLSKKNFDTVAQCKIANKTKNKKAILL
jgi:hypothetical protein